MQPISGIKGYWLVLSGVFTVVITLPAYSENNNSAARDRLFQTFRIIDDKGWVIPELKENQRAK